MVCSDWELLFLLGTQEAVTKKQSERYYGAEGSPQHKTTQPELNFRNFEHSGDK